MKSVALLADCATLATALFTGAAVYITLVEYPARLQCSPEIAVAQWRPSYKRATVMQASLAILGTLLSIAAWFSGAGIAWLVALWHGKCLAKSDFQQQTREIAEMTVEIANVGGGFSDQRQPQEHAADARGNRHRAADGNGDLEAVSKGVEWPRPM